MYLELSSSAYRLFQWVLNKIENLNSVCVCVRPQVKESQQVKLVFSEQLSRLQTKQHQDTELLEEIRFDTLSGIQWGSGWLTGWSITELESDSMLYNTSVDAVDVVCVCVSKGPSVSSEQL